MQPAARGGDDSAHHILRWVRRHSIMTRRMFRYVRALASRLLFAISSLAAPACAVGCVSLATVVPGQDGSEVSEVTNRRAIDALGPGVLRETRFAGAILQERSDRTAVLNFPSALR